MTSCQVDHCLSHDLQFALYIGPNNESLCKEHFRDLWASFKQKLRETMHPAETKAQEVIPEFLVMRQGGVLVRIAGCAKLVKVLATPRKVYLYPAEHKKYGLRKSYFWEDVTLESWGKKGIPGWSSQVRVVSSTRAVKKLSK